jgi:hypothetical protein
MFDLFLQKLMRRQKQKDDDDDDDEMTNDPYSMVVIPKMTLKPMVKYLLLLTR